MAPKRKLFLLEEIEQAMDAHRALIRRHRHEEGTCSLELEASSLSALSEPEAQESEEEPMARAELFPDPASEDVSGLEDAAPSVRKKPAKSEASSLPILPLELEASSLPSLWEPDVQETEVRPAAWVDRLPAADNDSGMEGPLAVREMEDVLTRASIENPDRLWSKLLSMVL